MRPLTRRKFLAGGGAAAVGSLTFGQLVLDAATAHHPAAAGSTDTFDGFVVDGGGQVFNVKNPAFGATGDTILSLGGGTTTAQSTTFKQTTTGTGPQSSGKPVTFAQSDIGKVITIQGAGQNGAVLSTTIVGVTDTTTVTLAIAASMTVAYAAFTYGTDDTAAIKAAFVAAGDTGRVYFPGAIYTIRGASNGGAPLWYSGRGGIFGRGGQYVPSFDAYRMSNSVLLCADATAGLILTGCARYERFMCNGNNISQLPLQCGRVANGVVTDAISNATLFDVWATQSTGTGWAISGARDTSFFDCGSSDNALDGLYIDGGVQRLDFFHFHERANLRYGFHGNQLVTATTGAKELNRYVRFRSGLCDGVDLRRAISKVYLRGAVDWRFKEMAIVGTCSGPTMDLDQSAGYGIDISNTWVYCDNKDGVNDICVQISGNAPVGAKGTFLRTSGSHFTQGETSVKVLGNKGALQYSGVDGWWDITNSGPYAAPGLPAAETLFARRTGKWQTATVLAPWSGNAYYRFMGEGWVEFRGNPTYSGSGSGPICTVPLGYQPDGAARHIATVAGTAPATITVAPNGDVSVAIAGATPLASGAAVALDGVSFPVGGN